MKVATVGTSVITDHFIQALKSEGSMELAAIYSRSFEHGRQFADKHGVATVYTEWNDLLNDPAIDVLYIASPNDMHFPQSRDALRAGKHVICEKPFVSNSQEFEALMAIVKETGRFCFDAITVMHLPNLQVIKDAVDAVAPVKVFHSMMVQYSSRYDLLLKGQMTNIFDTEHSGGALMDLGVYPLALALSVLGEPESIRYICNQYANGIDLSGILTLNYPNTVASLVFAKDAFGQSLSMISGEKGSLFIPEQPSRLVAVTKTVAMKSESIGLSQDTNAMFHEIRDFSEILVTSDWDRYWNYMSMTRMMLKIMDEARCQNGIVFTADTHKE